MCLKLYSVILAMSIYLYGIIIFLFLCSAFVVNKHKLSYVCNINI